MNETKLLLIEDDPMIQTLLVEVFSSDGYDVYTAMSDDFLLQSEKVRPEIVVVGCDGRGTFEEGWHVATTLRQTQPHVTLVMISTNTSAVHEVGQTERGQLFDGALRKPFSITELMRAVERCLYVRRSTSQIASAA